jgi:methionyl-tRNA synthetase
MQTVWWHSRDPFEEQMRHNLNADAASEILIVPAMLTPNGLMHVGHAAGPFLFADVLARILKLSGRKATVVQGTHGHLEHISIAAQKAGVGYYDLAERNTLEFRESLSRLGAEPDLFIGTRPNDRGRQVVIEVFERLFQKGLIVEVEHQVPFDPRSGTFQVDAFVHGKCPHCGGHASGTECEDCGALILDAELFDPVALDGFPLERQPLRRLFLDLRHFDMELEAFAARQPLPLQAKQYIDSWIDRGLPLVCITNPNQQGITVPLGAHADLKFNVVMEYVPRHLIAIEEIWAQRGDPKRWYEIPRDTLPDVHILFGVDNSFGRLIVIPAILAALDLHDLQPRRVFTNQMLTLEGNKFSTSRNHAIWVNEFVTAANSEPLRYYLCRMRPDTVSEDFSRAAFKAWKEAFWDGEVNETLETAFGVLDRVVQGSDLPGPGRWSATDLTFLNFCKSFDAELRSNYQGLYPNVRAATRLIEILIDELERYARSVSDPSIIANYSEPHARTAGRLVAQALVSVCVAMLPIAPSLARRIASRLGVGDPHLKLLEEDWMARSFRMVKVD